VFVRRVLAPLAAPALPALLRRRRVVAAGVRGISQLNVGYRRSPLSVEGSPALRGWARAGARLPDQTVSTGGRPVRVHELIARPGVHVLLERSADDVGSLGPEVHVHRLTSAPGTGLLAVRPDGYVGFRCGRADPEQLGRWLTLIGLVPGTSGG
jgi:hypothetical protein